MLTLLRNQVGIEPIFEGDHSRSKIIITPDTAKERCKQGIVKQLGPLVEDIKLGDYVIFGAYDGTLIAFDEELMIVMEEDGIDAVYVPEIMIDMGLLDNIIMTEESTVPYTELMKEVARQMSPYLLKLRTGEERKQSDRMTFKSSFDLRGENPAIPPTRNEGKK